MAEPTTAYIGLGSNLGDRQRVIGEAVKSLGTESAYRLIVLRVSTLKETPPLGKCAATSLPQRRSQDPARRSAPRPFSTSS